MTSKCEKAIVFFILQTGSISIGCNVHNVAATMACFTVAVKLMISFIQLSALILMQSGN